MIINKITNAKINPNDFNKTPFRISDDPKQPKIRFNSKDLYCARARNAFDSMNIDNGV